MMQKDTCAKQLNKKLFVSDLDGTLLKIGNEYSKGVSDENRETILKYVADGNLFAIASARDNYLDEIVPVLGFEPYYIGSNGSIIITQGKINQLSLSNGIYEEVIDYIAREDIDASAIYSGSIECFVNDHHHYPNNIESFKRSKGMFDHLQLFKNVEGNICNSIAIFINPKELIKCKYELKELLKGKAEVVYSDDDLININPLNCTKGNAVIRLADELGINYHNIGVIGDSDNDISMFDKIDKSFVMDHADIDVKKHAKTVVKSVKEALEIFNR